MASVKNSIVSTVKHVGEITDDVVDAVSTIAGILLGLKPTTLESRIKKLGLQGPGWAPPPPSDLLEILRYLVRSPPVHPLSILRGIPSNRSIQRG